MTRYLSPFGWIVAGTIVFWTILLFWVCGAWAAPFLGCECTPETGDKKVISFQLQFDTAAWIESPAVLTCGTGPDKIVCTGDSRTMCHDLAPISIGEHTVKGRSINIWESSTDSLPFSFAKGSVPSFPSFKVVK